MNKLTKSQEDFLDKFKDFISSENKVFILTGNAGTGKTFLINILSKHLKSINCPFRLMSPTGRAAKIVSEKTGLGAYTIHRSIYSFENIDNKMETGSGIQYFYKLKSNTDEQNIIYIIDESSMISNVTASSDLIRFGTGNLLQDLFQFTELDNIFSKRKILFIGDPFQLPPVNSNLSPALDKQFMFENNFEVMHHHLNELVRHKTNSDILSISNNLRDNTSIDFENFNKSKEVFVINDVEEFIESYLSSCDHSVSADSIIITYTNKQANYYNTYVRKYLFEGSDSITKGDRVLIVHNNYNHDVELLNGDFCDVVDVSNDIETITHSVRIKNSHKSFSMKNIRIDFQDVSLQVESSKNGASIINTNIVSNLLYNSERDLSLLEHKALYHSIHERYPEVKPGTPDYLECLKFDKHINSLRIKFGYAVTCHKAQGGEWDNVFVDISQLFGKTQENINRWLYTAFTRAKKRLYIFNPIQEM